MPTSWNFNWKAYMNMTTYQIRHIIFILGGKLYYDMILFIRQKQIQLIDIQFIDIQ